MQSDINPAIVQSVSSRLNYVLHQKGKEFYDLDTLLKANNQETKPWMIIPALGIWSGILYSRGNTITEKSAILRIEESSLSVLEREADLLAVPSAHTPPDRVVMLFHVLLSLSTILLIKGARLSEYTSNQLADYAEGLLCRNRALGMIRRLSAIGPYINYEQFPYLAPRLANVVHDDILTAKIVANEYIHKLLMLTSAFSPAPAEYLCYVAAMMRGPAFSILRHREDPLIDNIISAIDIWTTQCTNQHFHTVKGLPGWLDLVTTVARFLPLVDPSSQKAESPETCPRESSQYFSWKLGKTIGMGTKSLFRTRDRLSKFKHLITDSLNLPRLMEEADLSNSTDDVKFAAQFTAGLLLGYDERTNWKEVKKTASVFWKHTFHPQDNRWTLSNLQPRLLLSQINPASDLYWAICIGLSDAMLKTTESSQSLISPVTSHTDLNLSYGILHQDIKDIPIVSPTGESAGNPDVEDEQDTELKRRLGEVYLRLPGSMREVIKTCIRTDQTQMEIRHSISDLNDIVRHWLQTLLTQSLDRQITSPVDFHYINRSGKQVLPSNLSNSIWGHIFKEIAAGIPSSQYQSYRLLCEEYCKKIPNMNIQMLKTLGKILLSIGDIRNITTHEENLDEDLAGYLEKMNHLVLGNGDKTGAITIIDHLFRGHGG